MPVNFFEKELCGVQVRFNQTFGIMPLCNPRVRAKVIFAIVQMGILHKKIKQTKHKEDISKFVKIKDKLNEIFSTLTKNSEREQHDNTRKNQKPGIRKHSCFDNNFKRAY